MYECKIYNKFHHIYRNLNVLTFIRRIFFIYGIVGVIGYLNADIHMDVSPPQSTYPFMTVNHWPSCTDARSNTWRLVSSQFAHKGMTHIGGNTILGLLYGIILEHLHPYHWFVAISVYELGMVMGSLSFSYLNPFSTLVGCSAGIYAWMGCCISYFILNKNDHFKHNKNIKRLFYPALSTVILIHAICELIIYFAAYDSQTAYSAHFGGFFNGILIGLSLGLFQKPRWKKFLGLIGLIAFFVLDISLIVHYLEAWPPQFLDYNPTFHS
jgi:membrane associated rhomboid family serine protease